MTNLIKVDVHKATKQITDIFKDVSKSNVNKAIARAINHTLAIVQTDASKMIRKRYKMPADEVRNRIFINKASSSSVTGKVLASKAPLPLSVFNPVQITGNIMTKRVGSYRNAAGKKVSTFGSQKTSRVGVIGIQVQILAGHTETIMSAFIALSKANKGSVKAHGKYGPTGFDFDSQDKQTSLNSKSVFWALKDEKVQEVINTTISAKYNERLKHELLKGLKYAKEQV